MNGRCRLAWQKGNHAVFAEVVVKVERKKDGEAHLVFSDETSASWKTGVELGFVHFCERLVDPDNVRGLRVEILKVRGQAVDTTDAALAYCTFQAIKQASGFDVKPDMEFDEDTGKIRF